MADIRHFRASSSIFTLAALIVSAPAAAQATGNQAGPLVQPAVGADGAGDQAEIIVQARRRDESIQDVPLVVNAVTAESISKLNIQQFQEVQSLVPGLSLAINPNGVGSSATLRGVAFDIVASGNNGTIEFYLNDAPISANIMFQSMFDIGQIEVLRGPQGTLRGRASPSGSITVTTRHPDLSEAGGSVNGTLNQHGKLNFTAALNVPVIADKLAVRVAGLYDDNDGNRIHSIYSSEDPRVKTQGLRVSAAAEPADFLSLFAAFTTMQRDSAQFDQVESANIAEPGRAASPVFITADDRESVETTARINDLNVKIYDWSAQLRLAGQKVDYVGSYNRSSYSNTLNNDIGGFFGPGYSATLRGARQSTSIEASQTTHELRLSNDARLFGMFDYVVGGLYNKQKSPSALITQTPVIQGAGIATSFPVSIVNTPVARGTTTLEKSLFGNVIAHVGPKTEISAGTRYIHYESNSSLLVSGAPILGPRDSFTVGTWIYAASIKQRFNDNIMAYASFGSSWRPGSTTNPIVLRDNVAPSARVLALYQPDDEKSKSYEIGIKTDWLNNRLKVNLTGYYQDFDNYAYSVKNLFIAGVDVARRPAVFAVTSLAAAVPASVKGVEAEISFRPTHQLSLDANFSYSISKVKNGVVPCNNYGGVVPTTAAQILAANGGEQVALCTINTRAGTLAPFSMTLQGEYNHPLSANVEGYVRSLFTFNGNSQNDPLNAVDDVKSYGLLNLFAGIRDSDSGWEIGGYVKNVFDTQRVLTRNANPETVSYANFLGRQTSISAYRSITMTLPREFGVSLRVAFGSR